LQPTEARTIIIIIILDKTKLKGSVLKVHRGWMQASSSRLGSWCTASRCLQECRYVPEAQCSAMQRCTQEALNKLAQVLKAMLLC